MSYCNLLLLYFSNKIGWVHPTSWTLYTTIESLQIITSQKGPPSILIHICLLPLSRGVWSLACVQFDFQYQGATYEPTYMMRCTYNFWWCHMYVHLIIFSGKDILGPEGPYISFPRNFTKQYFCSKVRHFSDSAQRDLSKDPI